MAAQIGEKEGFLKSGIAPAAYGHIPSLVECAVADGTVGDAGERILTGEPQSAVDGAGGQNHRSRGVGSIVRSDGVSRARNDGGHGFQFNPGPQVLGLGIEPFRQLRTGDGGKAGVVLYLGRGSNLPADAAAFQNQNRASRAPGIDGGSQTGGTCPHDDEVKMLVHTKFLQTGGGKGAGPSRRKITDG